MKKTVLFLLILVISITFIFAGCNDDPPAESTPPVVNSTPNQSSHNHIWVNASCTAPKTCEECGATEGEALGHTWTDATCTSPKTCSVCQATDGEAKGHNYTTVVTAPTCTTAGFTTYTCSCGDTYKDNETAAIGHTEEIIPAKSATCTETGLTEGKKCSVCGTVTVAQTVVPAKGHTEEVLPAKVATCTETGLTEGKKCSVCGTVTVAQTVVPAKGHNYTTVVTDPTCTTEGFTTYTCSCGDTYKSDEKAAIGHTEEIIPAKAATCTETGLTEGKKCSVCGTVTVAQTVVPAKGHKEEVLPAKAATCTETGLTEGKKCSVCGTVTVKQNEVAVLGHDIIVDKAVAAGCETTGLTEGAHCSRCDHKVAQTIVPALGHKWTDATCTAPKTCSVCKATEGEALGHKWTDATCTAPKSCSVCKATEGAALGHKWTDATCTAPKTCSGCKATEGASLGHADADKNHKCDACGEDNVTNHVDGDDNDHLCDYGCGEIADEGCHDVDTDTDHKCDECGTENVTNHNYTSEITTEPTCTVQGIMTLTCACGDTYTEKVDIDANAHTWDAGEITTTPTCTEKGVKTYTCVHNSAHTRTEDVDTDANAHEWDAGKITTAPTCTEKGVKTYTCTHNAEHTYTDEVDIDANAHEWDAGKITTDPTCTKKGVKTYTCTHNAEHTYTDEVDIDANAHTWDAGEITTSPTCTEKGVKTYTCVHDSAHTRTEDVDTDANAHEWDAGEITTTPTCTEKGVKTYTCVHDSAHTRTEDVDTDANAHEWDAGEITTASTCTTKGVKTYTCVHNSAHTRTEDVDIDANAHTWDAGEEITSPTCTDKGYTTYKCACGDSYTDNETDSLGHTEGEWKIVRKPSPSLNGIKHLTCSVCRETLKEEEFAGVTLQETNYEVWLDHNGCVINAPVISAITYEGQVVEIPHSSITGTYDFSRAGVYPVTVTYESYVLPATIIITTYEVKTTSFWYALDGATLKLVTTNPEGQTETSNLSYTGTIAWGTPGVYPIEVTAGDATATVNIELQNMIYYEDFNDVTGNDNASILAQLGWKDNINYFENGQPTDKSVGAAWTNSKGYIFTNKWANTGISTNLSVITIDNGKLKIDNKTNNPNGATANFKLTDDGYMYKGLVVGKDYTMQYDITFGDDCASHMWVSAISGYKVEPDRPFVDGYFTRIYATGYANTLVAQLRSSKYSWINNYDTTSYAPVEFNATNEVVAWGGNGNRRIVKEIFGGTDADTLAGKTVTVKVVYTYVATDAVADSGKSCYDMAVYVKKDGGDFVLQYKTAFTKRGWLETIETQTGGYTGALALILGGYPGNLKGASGNSNIADLSSFGQNPIDDQTPVGKAKASGTVWIDNFAVWAGTGEMPALTDHDVYENHVDAFEYTVNADNQSCTITGIGTITDKELDIPEYIDGYKVTAIGDKAFMECETIVEVTIPSTVTSIGDSAFRTCPNLKYAYIPDSVTEMGTYVFYGCSSLEYAYLGKGITHLPDQTFNRCSSLFSLILEVWPTSAGKYVLGNASNSISLTVNNGSITILDGFTETYTKKFFDINLGTGVTSISDNAFSTFINVQSITYYGTESQWEMVQKGTDWHVGTSACKIDFVDGTEALLGHIYNVGDNDASICVNGQYCISCGFVKTEAGHVDKSIPAVDPTCTDTGLTEGTECARCHTVLKKQDVLDALGHEFGLDDRCTHNGCNAEGHTCIFDREVADDEYLVSGKCCTEQATYYLSCRCGLFEENPDNVFTATEALGHNWQPDEKTGIIICVRKGCVEVKDSEIPQDKNLVIGLSKIPIARPDMTEDELRDIVVSFMKVQINFAYRVDLKSYGSVYGYYIKNLYGSYGASKNLDNVRIKFEHGKYYGGVPYMGNSAGSLYRWLPFYDAQTGDMDWTPIIVSQRLNWSESKYPDRIYPDIGSVIFGNSCSSSCFWAWSRITNEVFSYWTAGWVPGNGFVKVGDYDLAEGERHGESTAALCVANGEQRMYKAYAQALRADGLVQSGHAVMIIADPVIVYNEDGTINGEESYMLIGEQKASFLTASPLKGGIDLYSPLNDRGVTYRIMGNYAGNTVNGNVRTMKWTFKYLFDEGFLPFTVPELAGTGIVEESYVSMNYSAETITLSKLESCSVTSNYFISDVNFALRDAEGNVVFTACFGNYVNNPSLMTKYSLSNALKSNNMYADKAYVYNNLVNYTDGTYTLEISCRLSTGELISVFNGSLVG